MQSEVMKHHGKLAVKRELFFTIFTNSLIFTPALFGAKRRMVKNNNKLSSGFSVYMFACFCLNANFHFKPRWKLKLNEA